MEEINFNSDEWKERLKGKSPEEIARIVGDYYEEKYGKEKFWSGRMIGLTISIIILIFIFLILYRLLNNIAR